MTNEQEIAIEKAIDNAYDIGLNHAIGIIKANMINPVMDQDDVLTNSELQACIDKIELLKPKK